MRMYDRLHDYTISLRICAKSGTVNVGDEPFTRWPFDGWPQVGTLERITAQTRYVA